MPDQKTTQASGHDDPAFIAACERYHRAERAVIEAKTERAAARQDLLRLIDELGLAS